MQPGRRPLFTTTKMKYYNVPLKALHLCSPNGIQPIMIRLPFRQSAGTGLTALACLLLPMTAIAERPAVVASIKPVELLIRAVADNQVTVSTLVPDGASPHTYQMRPSERQRLDEAQRVFWIGPDMETFLIRLLGSPELVGRAVMLDPDGDDAETNTDEHHTHNHGHSHDHKQSSAHAHDSDHDHGGEDPHLWIDPALGLAMARQIAQELSTLDGVDGARIQQGLSAFEQNLATTETAIREKLAPARDVDLFTYHDAFSRFAGHFDLKQAGVISPSPERNPGARHLNEVRGQLRAAANPCLMTEPQFNRQWWQTVTEGMSIPLSTWDPLASDIPANGEGYLTFLHSMADSVLGCLPENAE